MPRRTDDSEPPPVTSGVFTYAIAGVPDIDQRWDALPKKGSNYCVPTATLNWMYYLANHGRPGAITYRPADPTISAVVLLNLMAMANYMHTDPDEGTNSNGAFDGLVNWVHNHHIPAWITAERARDGADITYGDFKYLAASSALLVITRGYYKRNGSEFERVNGHALTLVGLQPNGNKMQITIHDPADDKANLKTQSTPANPKHAALSQETRNIEGDSVEVLRQGLSLTRTGYYRFIDGWMAIRPLFALTNPTASVLVSYSADILTGAITAKEFSLPINSALQDLAIHPSKPLASVITRDSGEIWTLDLAAGTWNKLTTAGAPQFLTYGGRDHRLFVAQGREILAFDKAGKPLGRLDAGAGVDAMSYDQKHDRLIVAAAGSKRLLSVASSLKVLGDIEAPEIPGAERLALSVNGHDGMIVLTRSNSPEAATVRWHESGALAVGRFRLLAQGPTSAAHVNRNGQLFVSEAGKIATFDADGNRTSGSPLGGLQAGPLLKVTRSSHNLDEARSRRKEWMN